MGQLEEKQLVVEQQGMEQLGLEQLETRQLGMGQPEVEQQELQPLPPPSEGGWGPRGTPDGRTRRWRTGLGLVIQPGLQGRRGLQVIWQELGLELGQERRAQRWKEGT